MAHRTKIEGTVYNITGGRVLVEGTVYNITGGRVLVEGTVYNINIESEENQSIEEA